MSRRFTRRHQPYDLENPGNWTVNKLKMEIEKRGMKLTSNVPKSTLLQIYNQLPSGISQNNYSEPNTVNPNSEMETPVVSEMDTIDQTNSSVNKDSNMNSMELMTAMQQTITSLQCTVNKLIDQKQSESAGQSSGTNMLQKVYQNSAGVPSHPPPSNNQGVPADELPHIDVVSETMRRNITDGKYVNLASLLLPEFDTPNFTTNDLSGLELLRQSRRDHRLDKPLSIAQFYQAFGIYKRIMCEAFPQRRLELDLYEADIGNICQHYGDIFYQYHVRFSRKAAAYLEKGIKVDWARRNKEELQLLVGGVKSKICDHCAQSDHESPFCPSQINVPGVSAVKKTEPYKGSTKYDPRFDRQGRPKMTHLGTEICNNFNAKGCNFKVCHFLHICKICKSPNHGEPKCESQKSKAPTAPPNTEPEKGKQKSLA